MNDPELFAASEGKPAPPPPIGDPEILDDPAEDDDEIGVSEATRPGLDPEAGPQDGGEPHDA